MMSRYDSEPLVKSPKSPLCADRSEAPWVMKAIQNTVLGPIPQIACLVLIGLLLFRGQRQASEPGQGSLRTTLHLQLPADGAAGGAGRGREQGQAQLTGQGAGKSEELGEVASVLKAPVPEQKAGGVQGGQKGETTTPKESSAEAGAVGGGQKGEKTTPKESDGEAAAVGGSQKGEEAKPEKTRVESTPAKTDAPIEAKADRHGDQAKPGSAPNQSASARGASGAISAEENHTVVAAV